MSLKNLIYRNPSQFSFISKLNDIFRQSKRLLKSSEIYQIILFLQSSADSYLFLISSQRLNSCVNRNIPTTNIKVYSHTMYQKFQKHSDFKRGIISRTLMMVIIELLGSIAPLSKQSDCLFQQMQQKRFICYTNFLSAQSSMQRLVSATFSTQKPSLLFFFLYILIVSVIENEYYLQISKNQYKSKKLNQVLFQCEDQKQPDCVQYIVIISSNMSNNRFGSYRPKLDDNVTKDLTPKSSKYSPKISPAFSSLRSGLALKADPSSKIKLIKPATTKHTQESAPYFHSKQNNQKKQFYNSNKRLELTKTSAVKNSVQYQPRSKSKSPMKQLDQIIREQVFIQPKIFNLEQRSIKSYENQHPNLPKSLLPISNFEPAKHSRNAHGTIRAYSASTNQGPVRQYNQDRVAIILNFAKPEYVTQWKKPAYFGVFDGHGGMDCADFLRDNLHTFVSKQRRQMQVYQVSQQECFQKCQKSFIDQSYIGKVDKSGSCGLVAFFYGRQCYIANVGDSRAIMSSRRGQIVRELSLDHKASEQFQQKRIIQAGGRIYQTKIRNANPNLKIFYQGEQHSFILGPHRAFPGRLSVTRTFGDIQAKLSEFGGNSRAIVCQPQATSITIAEEDDFIILGCDGIYDKLNNSEIIEVVWDTFRRDKGSFANLHQFCGKAVENIMKLAFNKKTLDNITVVMIAFEGLETYVQSQLQIKPPSSDQLGQTRKSKGISKLQSSFERKYVGRSVSPSNYNSLRTKSYYRPS